MSAAFFNSWALWEKLCFVLACAIVLTIFAGCVKLIHKHYQLRRYTRLAAKQKEEQKMQEHVVVQARDGARDIPFGVRAIESGIEVDGVWISRSNTPASSNPPSPGGSSVYDEPNPAKAHPPQPETKSLTNIPQLSMPQPVHPYPGHSAERSRSASRSPEVPASGAASAEKISRLPNASDDSIKIRVNQTYKPRQSSHLRFSSGDVLGIDTVHDPENKDNLSWDKQRTQQRLSRASLDSGSTQNYYVPQRPDHVSSFFSPSYLVRQTPVDNLPFTEAVQRTAANEDADISYDRFHKGGKGQLSSNRASVASTGWASVYSIPNERAFHVNQEPLPVPKVLPERVPASISGTGVVSDPEEPPSFQSFLDAHPMNSTYQLAPFSHDEDHAKQVNKVQPLQDGDVNRQMKAPDVIRKVNSGFEILRPGTLGTRQQRGDTQETRYGSDGSRSSRRSPKKLHRKTGSESTTGKSSKFVDV